MTVYEDRCRVPAITTIQQQQEGDPFWEQQQQQQLQQQQQQQQSFRRRRRDLEEQTSTSTSVSTLESSQLSSSASSPASVHHHQYSRRPRRLSLSKSPESSDSVNVVSTPWLLLLMLMSWSMLLPADSFVAFDHTSSCVRAFGCSEELVGFLIEIPSAEMCLQMCDANPACNFFTWRAGQEDANGMFHNFCFLHNRCESMDFTCDDCYSGPRSEYCPFNRNRNT